MRRSRLFPFAAAVTAIFVLHGCQTLSRGKRQAVPATSRPPGVAVFVDGTLAGKTPMTLNLARRDVHVVRFESAGYRPVEVRVTQRKPSLAETILTSFWWAPVGAVVLGLPAYAAWNALDDSVDSDLGGLGRGLISITAGAVAGWTAGTVIDRSRPSNRDLVPQTLFIEMEKADGDEAPLIVEKGREWLRQLRWIRIAAR
jgi:hypothetical protein